MPFTWTCDSRAKIVNDRSCGAGRPIDLACVMRLGDRDRPAFQRARHAAKQRSNHRDAQGGVRCDQHGNSGFQHLESRFSGCIETRHAFQKRHFMRFSDLAGAMHAFDGRHIDHHVERAFAGCRGFFASSDGSRHLASMRCRMTDDGRTESTVRTNHAETHGPDTRFHRLANVFCQGSSHSRPKRVQISCE